MAGKSKTTSGSKKDSKKKSSKKKTEAKKAEPKPAAAPKAAPKPKAEPKPKTVKSVTLWSKNRNHRIKLKNGTKVEFVNHELEVTDPALLDELWARGFTQRPEAKKHAKPNLG